MRCSQIQDASSRQMDDSVLCLPFCTAAYRARTTDDIHRSDAPSPLLYLSGLAARPLPAQVHFSGRGPTSLRLLFFQVSARPQKRRTRQVGCWPWWEIAGNFRDWLRMCVWSHFGHKANKCDQNVPKPSPKCAQTHNVTKKFVQRDQ